jgi:RHS repeat-associated protein
MHTSHFAKAHLPVRTLCLFLSYTLFISLCAPLAIEKVKAAARAEKPLSGELGEPSGAPKSAPAAGQRQGERREGEVLVRFRQGVSEQEKTSLILSKGGHRGHRLRGNSDIEQLDVPAGETPESVASQLLSDPQVELAEPNFLIHHSQVSPSDARFSEQWSLNNTGQNGGTFGSDIGVQPAWQTTTGSFSTTIAVIDSGVDFSHPDLVNMEWSNQAAGAGQDLHGWDYVANSGEIKDEQGHGTAIAGIIAAQGNNSIGTTGVMWRASLMSLRVLDATGTGDVAKGVEAIDYAVAHGAQVINISWGTDGLSLLLKDAIERAGRNDVLVVCSAGNDGRDLSTAPYYPASFAAPNLITVASTDNSDLLTSWSNRGGKQVMIAAPGVNLLTTQMGGGYWTISGTSASAPLVTGVAGLIKTARPWLKAKAVVKAIKDGARTVSTLRGKVSSGGVVNAAGALDALHSAEGEQPSASPSPGSDKDKQNPTPPTPGRGSGGNGPGGSFQTTLPTATSGIAGRTLPDLPAMRNVKGTPVSSSSSMIHANLICADCDPQNGGGNAGAFPAGGDPNFSRERNRYINRTGDVGVPGGGGTGQIKVEPGSRNVNWMTPILGLPGRGGLDLGLSLSYNSLVWTRDGAYIKYNADHGAPAPGFHIGFPILQQQFVDPYTGNVNAFILETPDGGRVELRQTMYSYLYESADGSYIQLQGSGNYYTMRDASGTRYEFIAASNGEYRCYQIKDRNGNYISIVHDADWHISNITDTLGRVITFTYDTDKNLTAITQNWDGVPHEWAHFYYGSVNVGRTANNSSIFNSTLAVNGPGANGTTTPVTVLTKVTVNDGSSYVFEYNAPYGQVNRITHYAKDNSTHKLSYTYYNMDAGPNLDDCPRFSEQYDWAENWNSGAEAHTSYIVTPTTTWTMPDGSSHTGTLSTVTMADRTTVQKIYAHTTGFDAGLPVLEETWSNNVKQRWVATAYTQDDTSLTYSVNARPIDINIYDAGNNRRRTIIGYNTFTLWSNASCSLPSDVYEYAADASTVFRKTHTDYVLDTNYIWDKHVIGLPSAQYLCNGVGGAQPCSNTAGSAALLSKTTYDYDWSGEYFQAAGPVQHANLGYISGRGNLVQQTRYDVYTDVNNGLNTDLRHQYGYDDSGNIIFDRDESNHQTNIEYADSFSDGMNHFTYAYPTAITDPDQVGTSNPQKSFTQYNYAFGGVTRVTGIATYTGQGDPPPVQTMLYDDVGRLQRSSTMPNGNEYAYTRWLYPDSQNIVTSYRTTKDLTTASEAYSAQVFDGAGRVIAMASSLPDSAGGFSAQQVVYDVMGRAVQQSNPTEVNAQAPAWTPTGDDAAAQWVWTTQAYDWKGRPTTTTLPDGNTRDMSYSGCGCAGGEVTTARDERGRRRRLTKDVLGRGVKLEELNWDQSVYATTNYTYDARDLLMQIDQSGRLRTFEYDGFGRLRKRTTPEQGETNYTYNADGTLYTMTDARLARSTYTYNNRHLLKDIVYDTSMTNVPVTSTPAVHYDYDAAGNRQAMTDGLGTVSYVYDQLSRLTTETRHFNAISNPTAGSSGNYALTYTYNLADQLMSVKNPFNVSYSYTRDNLGRVNTVNGDTHGDGSYWASTPVFVNSIKYRAFGAAKEISYGQANDPRKLTLNYDSRLRLTKWDLPGVLGYDYSYNYFGENSGRVTFARNLRNGSTLSDITLNRSYDYDQLGRLISAYTGSAALAHTGQGGSWTGDGPYAQGYTYDVWGNIMTRSGWGGEHPSYTVTPNAKNQPTTNPGNSAAMVYDPAGNLTSDGGQTFSYDATGQQTSANFYSTQMSYDGDRLRARLVENGTSTTYYVRSSVLGGQVMADINGSGAWVHGYVYVEGQLLAYQENGRVLWVHDEPITKAKRMTDSTGAIVNASELDPFGGQVGPATSQSGTLWNSQTWLQHHRYSTYERDSNSSDDAMNRRYNRWWSRFDQPDPYEGSYDLTNPQSFNRYAYVQNDPVNLIDPTGLNAEAPTAGGSCDGGRGIWIQDEKNQNQFNCIHIAGSVTVYAGPSGIPDGLINLMWLSLTSIHLRPTLDPLINVSGGPDIATVGTAPEPQGGKRDRCANAVQEAQNAREAINRRLQNAIRVGGLDAGHQKAISQSLNQLKNAVADIAKNCFGDDGPGGPPLFPEFESSIRLSQQAANEIKVPPIGWDGGRTAAEVRIKAVVAGGVIGSAVTTAVNGIWFGLRLILGY